MKINSHYGFTLLEVILSMAILSIGLLGLDAMQLISLRESRIDYFYSVATQQLKSMTERLQALGRTQGLPEQVQAWNQENSELLPHGKGFVNGSYPNYQINIQWGSSQCQTPRIGDSGCLKTELTV